MTLTAQSPVQVLIVDDSEDQRHLIRRYFELAGCEVIVAESAEMAIEAYEGVPLDLAVIDLILPGMSGWSLAERMQVERPDCAVVISSVLGTEDYPPTDASLPKPVSRASVRELLGNCVPGWTAP
ncbi:MAG: response regulator [Microbacteriaceae bacterium]|nr:response regulator [Microbacteriaceae bacterium]